MGKSNEPTVRTQALKMRKNDGFTLLELVLAVAIIGIIVAVAFPAYQNQVEDTRRRTAQADLLELAQWMERRYSNGFDYRDGGANPALPFTQSPQDGTAFYNLSFTAAVGRDTYTLQAVPTGAQAGDDCGTLTLDEQGNRGAALAAGCW